MTEFVAVIVVVLKSDLDDLQTGHENWFAEHPSATKPNLSLFPSELKLRS